MKNLLGNRKIRLSFYAVAFASFSSLCAYAGYLVGQDIGKSDMRNVCMQLVEDLVAACEEYAEEVCTREKAL